MASPRLLSRRRLLVSHGAVATLSLLAGCVGSDDSSDDSSNGDDNSDDSSNDDDGSDGGGLDDSDSDDSSNGDDDSSNDSSNGDDELDLREANVVGVSFEAQDGTYAFDVTLHHDDDGEEGYANWWQVERLDGTRLGRRELLHAHSRQPFTRSETIEIPADVDCVVVRGHDQSHEYGGLAVVVRLGSGEMRTVDQGPERQSFDSSDCPG